MHIGDNSYEMSNPVFWKKIRKNISECCLLKILPRVLSVKFSPQLSSPNLQLIYFQILTTLVNGLSIPVTCKIRVLPQVRNCFWNINEFLSAKFNANWMNVVDTRIEVSVCL